MFRTFLKRQSGRAGAVGAGLIAAALLLALALNLLLYGLTERYGWYVYTTEKYEHQIGDAARDALSEMRGEGLGLRIRFCSDEATLTGDPVYRLVWETARQMAEAADFVTVDTLDIMRDPETADFYRWRTVYDEHGTARREEVWRVAKNSVIVASDICHAVVPLSAFFVLDEDGRILAYNGEETFLYLLRYALSDTHRIAYYTQSHGEQVTSSMLSLLLCAGYEPRTVDLLSETPADTDGLLVVSHPRYDFYKGGEGIEAEIERLDAFVSGGGTVLVFLDPNASFDADGAHRLPKLAQWLTDRGVTPVPGVVRDLADGITADGYTLVVDYADSPAAALMREAARRYDDPRVIVRESGTLELSPAGGIPAEPLLVTSSSATLWQGGEKVASGARTVCAVSRDAGGGTLVVCADFYLTASDALDTDEYGNRDFFFACLSIFGGAGTPLGATMLAFEDTALHDLTMRSARLWTALLCVVLPGAVAAGGVVYLRRRRRR